MLPPCTASPALQYHNLHTILKGHSASFFHILDDGTYAEVVLTPMSGCTVLRTIVHEIFHGLSFYHTHTRPDRDDYVRINFENVQHSQQGEFEYCSGIFLFIHWYYILSTSFYLSVLIYFSGCCCDTFDLPYDCQSVQHYATNQMSKNGEDTITSLSPSTCKLYPFSQWNQHSPACSTQDWVMVAMQYDEFC